LGHVLCSHLRGGGAPGTGELPIWDLLEVLRASRYDGAVGLEYETASATEGSLGFMGDARAKSLFG
jgi:hydroxypyruvate isomerase